jgi:Fe-S-cluster-containing dehydrogenase component
MAEMAILQEVDKCVRCNGCVISCKRTWGLMGIAPANDLPNQKVAINQRVVIKPQRRVDNAPFVRYSCWHCDSPPCAVRCPWKAIKKEATAGTTTGAVSVDLTKCNPNAIVPSSGGKKCGSVCRADCGRGGYPKVGLGREGSDNPVMQKCTMCSGRAGLGGNLPSKASADEILAVPDKACQPACVYTCPANAMKYDTVDNIRKILTDGVAAGTYTNWRGGSNMFWASKYMMVDPKADPFMEDHISPMVSSLLSGPFAKAALVPTLVAGGLLALSARRAKIEEESCLTAGEAR